LTRPFSPYKKISEVPIREIQHALISVFKIRGIPEWIKVDNGRPLGDPQLTLVPPLALWLIGCGINVIWNRPATPQDNAIVERSQGVMANWTHYSTCKDTFELQIRLWKEAEFHNLYFPIRRKGNKTRMELFPKLIHTGKAWNPADFDLNRILAFLAKGDWQRKVSTNGQFSFYAQQLSVGVKYKNQRVSIRLNPEKNQWDIFDEKGEIIKSTPSPFSIKSVWKLDFS
jgi:hypothetical protein